MINQESVLMTKQVDPTSLLSAVSQCVERGLDLYELLNQLELLGSRLVTFADGRLGVQLPPGLKSLPPPLIEAIRAHRTDLLQLLFPQCLYADHQHFWQHPVGYWVCSTCHPAPQAEVEMISLAALPC